MKELDSLGLLEYEYDISSRTLANSLALPHAKETQSQGMVFSVAVYMLKHASLCVSYL